MVKKKKGMTLLEIIVSMAVFSIVAVAITSTLMLTMKLTANNKAKLFANENSVTFIEFLKSEEYRPKKDGDAKQYKSGWYYVAFNDNTEVESFIKNSIDEPTSNPDIGMSASWNPDLATVKSNSGQTTEKFVLAINVRWNSSGDVSNVYDIDTYSWEVDRGETSKVNRRILLAPQK